MKYTIVLIACMLLFAQCKKSDSSTDSIQPTGSYDTLGIHWTAIEKDHIIYYFEDFSVQSDYAKNYVDRHEDAYSSLDQVFKSQMPRKLRFFVWNDATLAAQLLGHSLGFTRPEECACYVRPDQTRGHEMTHALTFWSGGVLPTTLTRFVNEGVAVAFDLNGNNKMETAKSAVAGRNIHSVTELWSGSLQSAPEEVFYPVAGAFMDYLYKQNLPDRFNALLKHQTIEEAEDIYGKERLDSLIGDFNSQLGL